MAVVSGGAGGAGSATLEAAERLRLAIAARMPSPQAPPRIPVATVSGVASTTVGMIEWFDRETDVALITTKSFQLQPNPGNREPIITEPEPGCFGNAVGLKNPGVETAVAELAELRRRRSLRALLIVSLSGTTPEEFRRLAVACAPLADALELNYSCPHASAGYGADIGRDEAAVASITAAVVDAVPDTPVLVKLTPNVPDIARMAAIAVGAGAAGVTAINTVGPAVYHHDSCGAPILSNPPDGRGGKSGIWVFDIARDAVAAVRAAVGPGPLIVGMGGVDGPERARTLYEAGADVVGVGSALGRVHQARWPAFLLHVSGGGHGSGDGASRAGAALAGATATPGPAVRRGAGMRLEPRAVTHRRELGDDLFELSVEPAFPCAPGQAVFLWLPGVGEKPFAPALPVNGPEATPADGGTVFFVRRRGPLTRALGDLTAGDTVYVRGPYGDRWSPAAMAVDAPTASPPTVLLVAAGSGAATLPGVAAEYRTAGFRIRSAVGVRHVVSDGLTFSALRRVGVLEVVEDGGRVGRVLDTVTTVADGVSAAFVCGPEPFMELAISRLEVAGVPRERIHVSLERPMRCGVGMCGECHNNGRLTCQYGTVVAATDWRAHE